MISFYWVYHLDEYTPIVKTGRVSSNYPAERYIFEINSKYKSTRWNKKRSIQKCIRFIYPPQFFSTIASEFKDTINKRIANFNDEEKANLEWITLTSQWALLW